MKHEIVPLPEVRILEVLMSRIGKKDRKKVIWCVDIKELIVQAVNWLIYTELEIGRQKVGSQSLTGKIAGQEASSQQQG